MYRDRKYIQWIKEAGIQWMIQRQNQPRRISGKFTVHIILYPPDKRQIDIDNRMKVLLDFAQNMGIIDNDSLCRKLLVEYPEDENATPGCLLKLSPLVS